ncbi:formimidoylglutamate deiminase [Azohydromonas caseinilytica]|uniref:Formimidoylglutamate deiminase n=1 Tax=Azohydromonas caseinilytica TaxID=2728836 RepID=A0A848FEE8_9BURK|nr:formimidoylglutamate deiminase [Azohydromonas caseinilytica]NML18587.1 formimidoylglutamate deiminase [Azohydromonas caseinilytica]
MPEQLWAARAWLPGGWRERVLLEIERDGRWAAITPDAEPPPGAEIAAGPLLPALVDAHSHAFQRAFAGLAETREGETDDFWSWREHMYRVALRITPEQLQAVAAQLYVELLRGGYTQVCEFHYLQHDPDGRPHEDPLRLSWTLADAAAEAGIGLTLLPVLYERAGFSQPALRGEQRRFALDARGVWEAARRIEAAGRPLLNAGLAIHSLRAAAPGSIAGLRELSEDFEGPIHIHVAEQAGEVEECVAATGVRPIAWLYREGLLDPRWQLVHATHATRKEIAAVDASEANVVLCPSTEANLGDGVTDLDGWLSAGVCVALGSDSQVSRDALEELRWLEYGQRLQLRRRNVAAAPATGRPSTAARLLDVAVHAGARAAGEPGWGLVEGARADALVADAQADGLLGVPPPRLLDALVFAGPPRPWRDVMVAGRWVIRDSRHEHAAAIAARFNEAMAALWRD